MSLWCATSRAVNIHFLRIKADTPGVVVGLGQCMRQPKHREAATVMMLMMMTAAVAVIVTRLVFARQVVWEVWDNTARTTKTVAQTFLFCVMHTQWHALVRQTGYARDTKLMIARDLCFVLLLFVLNRICCFSQVSMCNEGILRDLCCVRRKWLVIGMRWKALIEFVTSTRVDFGFRISLKWGDRRKVIRQVVWQHL